MDQDESGTKRQVFELEAKMEAMKVSPRHMLCELVCQADYEKQISVLKSNANKVPEGLHSKDVPSTTHTKEELIQMIKIAEGQNLDLQKQKKALEDQVSITDMLFAYNFRSHTLKSVVERFWRLNKRLAG